MKQNQALKQGDKAGARNLEKDNFFVRCGTSKDGSQKIMEWTSEGSKFSRRKKWLAEEQRRDGEGAGLAEGLPAI